MSSSFEGSQVNADASVRMEEQSDLALPSGLFRRNSRTRPKPNSRSSPLFFRQLPSMTPRETNRRHVPDAIPAMGASHVAWENNPNGKPVAGRSVTPERHERNPGMWPAWVKQGVQNFW